MNVLSFERGGPPLASSLFFAEPPVQTERSQIAAAARLLRVLDYVGAAPVFGDANNREALRTSCHTASLLMARCD